MGYVTQIAPKVLVGLLADRPQAGAIDQGTLFHSTDTLECFVLVIDHLTQVRRWDPFCGNPGGFLKFANSLDAATGGSTTQFMDDAGVGTAGVAAPTAQQYPLGVASRVVRMSAFIDPMTPVPTGATVTFVLAINGVATGVTIPYAAGLSGPKTTTTGLPLAIGPTDRVDIIEVSTAGSVADVLRTSATLLLG